MGFKSKKAKKDLASLNKVISAMGCSALMSILIQKVGTEQNIMDYTFTKSPKTLFADKGFLFAAWLGRYNDSLHLRQEKNGAELFSADVMFLKKKQLGRYNDSLHLRQEKNGAVLFSADVMFLKKKQVTF